MCIYNNKNITIDDRDMGILINTLTYCNKMATMIHISLKNSREGHFIEEYFQSIKQHYIIREHL